MIASILAEGISFLAAVKMLWEYTSLDMVEVIVCAAGMSFMFAAIAYAISETITEKMRR